MRHQQTALACSLLMLPLATLSGCGETEQDGPGLELSFLLPGDTTFLRSVSSYQVRVLYSGGNKTGQLTEATYGAGASQVVMYGLLETNEGESARLEVTAYTTEEGAQLPIAAARSGPLTLQRNASTAVTLYLAPYDTLSTLSTPLLEGRTGHTATPLGDGTTLLAGGLEPDGTMLESSLLFDDGLTSLAFGGLTRGPALLPRVHHSAAFVAEALGTQRPAAVLAGGDSRERLLFVSQSEGTFYPDVDLEAPAETLSEVLLFDPSQRTFQPGEALSTPRAFQESLPVGTGSLMLCGGLSPEEDALIATKVEPTCIIWNPGEGMPGAISTYHPRVFHQFTRLESGELLLTGGAGRLPLLINNNIEPGVLVGDAEVIDEALGNPREVGKLVNPRLAHQATVIPGTGGLVLISGGYQRVRVAGTGASDNMGELRLADTAEVYDPTEASSAPFRRSASLNCPRAFHTTIPLSKGEVMIVGGIGRTPGSRPPIEIFKYQDGDSVFELLSAEESDCDADSDLLPNSQSEVVTTDPSPAISLLSDGNVLLSGGDYASASSRTQAADLLITYLDLSE